MASMYADQVEGETIEERLESLAKLFSDRKIPFAVEQQEGALPILTALACPYPDLAEQDRSICSLEKILFSELVGERVNLNKCRLDGESCCTFEVRQEGTS